MSHYSYHYSSVVIIVVVISINGGSGRRNVLGCGGILPPPARLLCFQMNTHVTNPEPIWENIQIPSVTRAERKLLENNTVTVNYHKCRLGEAQTDKSNTFWTSKPLKWHLVVFWVVGFFFQNCSADTEKRDHVVRSES